MQRNEKKYFEVAMTDAGLDLDFEIMTGVYKDKLTALLFLSFQNGVRYEVLNELKREGERRENTDTDK